MILFDCERLRYPFNGFYSYCYNLANALIEEEKQREEKMCLYLTKHCMDMFPDDVAKKRCHHYHRRWLPISKKIRLWHATNQFARYLPDPKRGLPVLLTVHDLNYLYSDAYIHANHSGRTAETIARANHIVTISEYVKKDILEHFDVKPEDVDVVYNGACRYSGPIVAPAVIPDRPFLLYLGRIDKIKNVVSLPPLLAKNDFLLILAGNASDGAEDAIMECARKWGVQDRVIMTGPVSEGEKHWYLQNCSAFLQPSLAEGFGLPILEAMQYHRPVFASQRTSLPEVGGDCAFYFNYDFEPEGMQKELEDGLNAFAAGKISKEAMDARLDFFSWEKAAKGYYDVYEKMIPGH